MVLLIPSDLVITGWTMDTSVRDFILALTVGCIVFTTFIKTTTIIPLMRRFKIDQLHEVEEVEFIEGRMYMLIEVLAKIERLAMKDYITTEERDILMTQYHIDMQKTKELLDTLIFDKKEHLPELIRRVVTLHALGIEKYHLRELYMYNEISEEAFKTLIRKMEAQIYRIETGRPQLRGENEEEDSVIFVEKWLRKLQVLFSRKTDKVLAKYMIARARKVTSDKAIKGLIVLQGIDFITGRKEFQEVVSLYEDFRTKAHQECENIRKEHHDKILAFDSRLTNKSLLKTQASIVEDLYHKEIISPKLYLHFKEIIEADIYKK